MAEIFERGITYYNPYKYTFYIYKYTKYKVYKNTIDIFRIHQILSSY